MLELKICLHIHTNHSDSISSVEEVVDSARTKKLDGIAITDHNTMAALDDPLICNQDLILIPGVEVKTWGRARPGFRVEEASTERV